MVGASRGPVSYILYRRQGLRLLSGALASGDGSAAGQAQV